MISSKLFFSISLILVLKLVVFSTKSLTLGMSFSTVVRAALVAKLVTVGILFLTSFALALRAVVVILGVSFLTPFILILRRVLVAKSVTSGILSSIFLILALYESFLTTSFFTASLS